MGTNFSSDRVIIKLNPTTNSSEITNLQADIGVIKVTQASQLGIDIWQIPSGTVEQTISAYKDDPRIEYIEPDYIITLEDIQEPSPTEEKLATITPQATTPNDPGYSQLWGLNNTGQSGGTPDADIDAPEAWDIQKGNQNLVIGVIDTGVDYNHPDLVGNIWANPGEIPGDGIDNDNNGYIDDTRGWDFANNDNNPMDGNGHGTHVSGTIAGKGNNGLGVTGVAWDAKIMPLKFLSDGGSGYTSNAILAINYATTKGVKLTNNSWGGAGYSQALSDAINTAGQQGALFIAAAGNSSLNTDTNPSYPASYNLPNIISVASTTNTDGLSSFSNYGAITVDLGAPGSSIYSTWPNSTYNTISGTSMASPHVTGAAALLWSQNPTWTVQQVKNKLMETTDPISALSGKTVSGGRLNINNALAGSNPAPSNDHFINRILLYNLPVSTTGSNVGATGETGEPLQSETINSVWWSWTAPSSGTFTIDTKNSNFDTYLSVFTGLAVDNLSLIDSNNDGGGNATSLISLNATAGTTYQIAVDGFQAATGSIQLNIAASDTTPPTASSFTPADNATGVAVAADLVVNFSEAIQKGTGNIVIKQLSDDSVVETIAVTASNVTLNGNQLTINPTANLVTATDYYIEIANGAIKDLAGNDYAGITGNSIWNFKTQGFSPIDGTPDDDIFIGTANPDNYNGLGGNDLVLGFAGNDSLNGGDDNDSLDGGAGADQLQGEAGDDIYTVDNTGDIVTELANQGLDLVQSAITYTLPVNVEDLTLTGSAVINGTGNTLNNTIIGNNANNTLDGSTGADLLVGRAGNDTYIVENANDVVAEALSAGTDLIQSSLSYTLPVNVENLTLTGTAAINGTGNALVNIITGNTVNNILNGSTGADQLTGGTGNDTYVVDNAGDIVTELASGGTDLIQSSVTYTLPVEVENLTLTGITAINGTGNELVNTVIGNTANNILDGSTGADQLTGGTGNDTYFVDNAGDIVTELASGGTDLVQSSVTYILPANVENLTLIGSTAINGTGNNLANTITGNTANNNLNGGAANDPLTGGLGADQFIYNTNAAFATSAVGVDTITDFDISQTDQIVLDKTTFTSISSIAGTGFSVVSEFATVTTDALAAISDATIVYNSTTGGLFYNQNGTATGFGTGAKFLTLTTKPVLTATQFVIQA